MEGTFGGKTLGRKFYYWRDTFGGKIFLEGISNSNTKKLKWRQKSQSFGHAASWRQLKDHQPTSISHGGARQTGQEEMIRAVKGKKLHVLYT